MTEYHNTQTLHQGQTVLVLSARFRSLGTWEHKRGNLTIHMDIDASGSHYISFTFMMVLSEHEHEPSSIHHGWWCTDLTPTCPDQSPITLSRPLGLLEVFSRAWRRTPHTSINFLSITRGLKLRLKRATVDDAADEDSELNKQRGIFWHLVKDITL
ncbi:hypothetical protein LB504_004856 [Fusarium proliferatum]|nr:hypothetical protein LB504_004856 [Fusarium proliferatum]